jgi:hypothetical protein
MDLGRWCKPPICVIKLQKEVINDLQWIEKHFEGLWKCNKVEEGIEKVYIAFEDISKPLQRHCKIRMRLVC